MAEVDIWRFLHILMFVGWLGGDAGVYIASRKAMDSSLQFETRLMLLHTALRIELIPRIMWKMALPLGMMLSRDLGLVTLTDGQVAAVWVLSIIWCSISVASAWYYYNELGKKLAAINNWLVGLMGVLIIGVAWLSAAGYGPFEQSAAWLLWKLGLYGLIQFTALGIIVGFNPIGGAFMKLGDTGSTPELEGFITRSFNIAAIPIWATYTLVFVVAWLGTVKMAG